MKRRKIEIRIEKRERIVFSRLPDEIRLDCRTCGTEAVFVSPECAAVSLASTTREIFRLVEARRIHYFETEVRATLICLASLEDLILRRGQNDF